MGDERIGVEAAALDPSLKVRGGQVVAKLGMQEPIIIQPAPDDQARTLLDVLVHEDRSGISSVLLRASQSPDKITDFGEEALPGYGLPMAVEKVDAEGPVQVKNLLPVQADGAGQLQGTRHPWLVGRVPLPEDPIRGNFEQARQVREGLFLFFVVQDRHHGQEQGDFRHAAEFGGVRTFMDQGQETLCKGDRAGFLACRPAFRDVHVGVEGLDESSLVVGVEIPDRCLMETIQCLLTGYGRGTSGDDDAMRRQRPATALEAPAKREDFLTHFLSDVWRDLVHPVQEEQTSRFSMRLEKLSANPRDLFGVIVGSKGEEARRLGSFFPGLRALALQEGAILPEG